MSVLRVPRLGDARRSVRRLKWWVRLAALQAGGHHRVALASFPRSGNTWFRFLLENATGELTGISDASGVARILPRGEEGVVIKTHKKDSHRYTRAIHLVRNPFDVVDSYFDWKKSTAWQWKYGETDWESFVKIMVPLWRDHTRHWLDTPTQTFRIRYEDCLSDPVTQFRALLEWLGRPIPDEALEAAIKSTSFDELKRKQSASSEMGARFFRRGTASKGIERFSPEQRRELLAVAGAEIEACGYTSMFQEEVR